MPVPAQPGIFARCCSRRCAAFALFFIGGAFAFCFQGFADVLFGVWKPVPGNGGMAMPSRSASIDRAFDNVLRGAPSLVDEQTTTKQSPPADPTRPSYDSSVVSTRARVADYATPAEQRVRSGNLGGAASVGEGASPVAQRPWFTNAEHAASPAAESAHLADHTDQEPQVTHQTREVVSAVQGVQPVAQPPGPTTTEHVDSPATGSALHTDRAEQEPHVTHQTREDSGVPAGGTAPWEPQGSENTDSRAAQPKARERHVDPARREPRHGQQRRRVFRVPTGDAPTDGMPQANGVPELTEGPNILRLKNLKPLEFPERVDLGTIAKTSATTNSGAAICIAGGVRSFYFKRVYENILHNAVDPLRPAEIFMVLNKAKSADDNGDGHGIQVLQKVPMDRLRKAIDAFQPRYVEIHNSSDCAAALAAEPSALCCDEEEVKQYMQFHWIKRCFQEAVRHEESSGTRFSLFVRLRPDVFYYRSLPRQDVLQRMDVTLARKHSRNLPADWLFVVKRSAFQWFYEAYKGVAKACNDKRTCMDKLDHLVPDERKECLRRQDAFAAPEYCFWFRQVNGYQFESPSGKRYPYDAIELAPVIVRSEHHADCFRLLTGNHGDCRAQSRQGWD